MAFWQEMPHTERRTLSGAAGTGPAAAPHGHTELPPFPGQRFGTLGDYLADRAGNQEVLAWRAGVEHSFLSGDEAFEVSGICAFCGVRSSFKVDYKYAAPADPLRDHGLRIPNWRERLVCTGCGLNNRTRATVHFLRGLAGDAREKRVFFSERITPLYRAAASMFPQIVGSEFLRDGTARGAHNAAGLRHEDMTDLSFAGESLDLICTCDVLEHVPDYMKAARECFRCLAPGGALLISVPFGAFAARNLVRARMDSAGGIEHLEPPEYHGDPMGGAGALCFHHFGWEFLDQLRRTGFGDVAAHFYWSDEFAYLGDMQMLIVAWKRRPPSQS